MSRPPLSVAALPGDGVGPEVTGAAIEVLDAAAAAFGFEVRVSRHPVGWSAAASGGEPLPPATLEACLSADAVLLGAVGHPAAEAAPPERRPEAGLLALRKALGCHANLRPVRLGPGMARHSPLRAERVEGTDLLIVRELGGGIYYGEPRGDDGTAGRAFNTMTYADDEVERVARVAFELARGRRGHVVSVDKANVLDTSRLWRRVVARIAEAYPDVTLEHMLVDRAAMELVLRPAAWDVWLTANLFGDVLSDEAAAVVGSIGLLPSASLGGRTGLYEPVHGSAPELAGRGVANPVGAILSVAMMLRHSFGRSDAAEAVERAVDEVLGAGMGTPDLTGVPHPTGTRELACAVADAVRNAAPGPEPAP